MVRARVIGLGIACLIAAGAALPAQADQICNDLVDCKYKVDVFTGDGEQPRKAPWGAVKLTQENGFVEISVILKGKNSFVNNAYGDAFMFSLSKGAKVTAGDILTTSSAFTFDPHAGKTSSGVWQYGMICDACGGGPSKVRTLDFRITGITLADFIANNMNFSFGANLCFSGNLKNDRCRAIGNAAAQYVRDVPEPLTLSLFGVGLLAMGALGWRRKRASTTPA